MKAEEYLKKKYPYHPRPRRLSFSYKEVVAMLDEFTNVQESELERLKTNEKVMTDEIEALNQQLEKEKELLSGLVRDFKEVISDNDIETERAGYLVEAEKYLKTKKNESCKS